MSKSEQRRRAIQNPTFANQCLALASKATPGPWHLERIDHSKGDIAYEVNDKKQLVAFYEDNFKQPMKAKFNAELYVASRTIVPELARRLNDAIERLKIAADLPAEQMDCEELALELAFIQELEEPLE